MNEGWASYWHKKILESLDLEQGLHLEFIVRHNQVVRPIPGQINPYHLGFKIWEDIYRRHTNPTPEEIKRDGAPTKNGEDKIFEVREVERDSSFLRRYLTEELMREMDMFEYEARGDDLVIDKVSDEEGWKRGQGDADQERRRQLDPGDQGRGRRLRPESHALPEALSRRPRSAARIRGEDASPTCSGCGDAKSCSRRRCRASARCCASTSAASRCAR